MALRVSLQVLAGRAGGRRRRLIAAGVGVALAVGSLTGCTVSAGSAVLVGGNAVSEQSVQADTAAFISSQTVTTPPTPLEVAGVNRAQISYQVRHALIADALQAKGLVVSDAQIAALTAQLKTQGTNIAQQLQLPPSESAGAIYDLLAIEALLKAQPAVGAPVGNVSVTAEGVPAPTRDEAVALRSKYLADPATMDTAVSAAGANGLPKDVYQVLTTPGVGPFGFYQPSTGGVVILPTSAGYFVVRTSDRAVHAGLLTETSLSASKTVADYFNLGALLLVPYENGAHISVNPRYGVWDPSTVQVVPGNDGL